MKHDTEARTDLIAASGARPGVTRRGIYLRDGFVLVALSLITVALFGMTLFLFRSFEAHRADLGRRWSARGRLALAQGHPDQAATALRTALSYAPDDFDDQLLLAQALAGAGHLEAANNYFLSLWEVHPGDGFLNLQLARLARQRGDAGAAVNYYRASIFGNWEGTGVQRRREVRLELADYLVGRGEVPAAQAELLIAAGNAPEKDLPLHLQIADRLRALGDLPDALRLYKGAVALAPHDPAALGSEGRTEYAMAEYPAASRSLTAAADLARRTHGQEGTAEGLAQLAAQAHRLPELSLGRDLSAGERAQHILLDAGVAQSRLKACTVQLSPPPMAGKGAENAPPVVRAPPPTPAVLGLLNSLHSRWMAQGRSLNLRALARDSALEDTEAQLIEDTEMELASACGPPTGDDALLLQLARRAQATGGGAE